jgi:hypothetical protein
MVAKGKKKTIRDYFGGGVDLAWKKTPENLDRPFASRLVLTSWPAATISMYKKAEG